MLALIAGRGALPQRVAGAQKRWPTVVALEGTPPDTLIPEITFRLETLGTLFTTLRDRGVTQVAFAGAIDRPQVDSGAIDMATAPLVPKIIAALRTGDDGAVRVVINLFEDAGFDVLGVADALPDVLLPVGVATKTDLGPSATADADRAATIINAMAQADVGQSCVVAQGQALAIEALPGTEWMLRSLTVPKPLSDHNQVEMATGPTRMRDPNLPKGGILFKAPKPGQEMRIDMPTIGPDTIAQAAEVELDGIVIAAGGVMVLDPDRTIEQANRLGLFLWVRD